MQRHLHNGNPAGYRFARADAYAMKADPSTPPAVKAALGRLVHVIPDDRRKVVRTYSMPGDQPQTSKAALASLLRRAAELRRTGSAPRPQTNARRRRSRSAAASASTPADSSDPDPPSPAPRYLRPQGVADLLGLARTTVYRAISTGALAADHVGRSGLKPRYRISFSAVSAWIRDRCWTSSEVNLPEVQRLRRETVPLQSRGGPRVGR